MKTLKTLLLALLISSLNLACKKEKQDQPTQTGANNMYAKINGTPWKRKACWSCIGGGSGLSRNYDDRISFYIVGQDHEANSKITLVIPNLIIGGKYELSNQNINYGCVYNNNINIVYFTTNNSKGSVTITKLDLNNKIISGTFEFIAEDENNPTNTVKVTDGWFDITYR